MSIYHTLQLHLLPPDRVKLAAAFIVFLFSSPLATAQEGASVLDAKRQNELVYLVRQDCGSCHGMTLKGGLGTPLLPPNVKDTPIEALVSIILDGVPDTPMPPWRGLLSETEAEWIARQLKKGLPE
ncbi:MAG: cytochrome c [bacterium]|nr:cytochrome c [bacterium]